MKKTQTLEALKMKCFEEFQITQEFQNFRLRLYVQYNQTMQDSYTGRENSTFNELNFFGLKYMAIETKTSDQIFQEYDA